MTDTAKGRLQGFFFGAAIAAVGFVSVMVLVITPQTKAANQKWADTLNAEVNRQASSCRQLLSDQHDRDLAARAPTATGYTLLYDGAVSPQSTSAGGYELLNLLRPGLGSTLAKMSQPKTTPFAAPAWILIGKGTPVFYGDVTRAAVVKLDAQGNRVSEGMPLSAAQVQANPKLLEVSQ